MDGFQKWRLRFRAKIMMIMLRDDSVIEIFESPERPPNWIEGIDIENGEYQFCDHRGLRYIGVINRKFRIFRHPEFHLEPEGVELQPVTENNVQTVTIPKLEIHSILVAEK